MSLDTRGLWSSLSCFEGPDIFRDEIVRLRWIYQITRALSARLNVQRERLRSSAQLTGLVPRDRMTADVRLSFAPQPGTAVYVAWRSLEDRNGPSRAPSRSQLFLKASYVIRF